MPSDAVEKSLRLQAGGMQENSCFVSKYKYKALIFRIGA
jgi:hypothetical protein